MAKPASLRARRREQAIGWLFVAIQALLLVTLVLVPGGAIWSVTSPVAIAGWLLIGSGIGLGAWSIITFGAGVTPTPVPSPNANLVSSGPFRWIRHPMYTGVMAIALGITLRTPSGGALALLAAIVIFFNVKARWEEQRLVDIYAGYPSYRKSAGRFLPHLLAGGSKRSPT